MAKRKRGYRIRKVTGNSNQLRAEGRDAYAAGVQVWRNPRKDDAARLWTEGWREAAARAGDTSWIVQPGDSLAVTK